MSDAKDIILGTLNLAAGIAFIVFTWQHNVLAMVLTFAVSFAVHVAQD